MSQTSSAEDIAHLRQCYETFAQKEKALDIFNEWSVTVFPDDVLCKIAQDDTNGKGTKQLQVLGIGSGTGEIDYMFLQQLTKKYANLYFTSLEISPDNINRFKSIVARGNLKGVTFDWKQLSWEHYHDYNIKKCYQPRMFHLIYSVFSIRYSNDVNAAVVNMYESLDEGGVLLMIVISDDSGTYKLRTKFPQLMETDDQAPVSSKEIRTVLDANGIPYQSIRQPSRVDITSAFTKGRKEGSEIVDHLSKRVNFLNKGEPRLVNDFMAYLKSPYCVEREQRDYLFINDWDAIIVTK